jgi:hypothetical protein
MRLAEIPDSAKRRSVRGPPDQERKGAANRKPAHRPTSSFERII